MSQPDISLPLPEGAAAPMTPAVTEAVYASPGVTNDRKVGTGIFLAILAAFTIFVAAEQGASVVVSTIIGALFIGGFIAYLRIVAPPPFRITLAPDALRREEQGMERIEINMAQRGEGQGRPLPQWPADCVIGL